MKALVTGGAGFIGSNLVRQLLSEGEDVVVLDNLSSGYADNLTGLPVKFVNGDVRDEETVSRIMDGVDVIFHLAASVGNKRSIDFPVTDAEINVIGTIRLLEAARRAGVRKVVVSSSAGIFGELKSLPIKENHEIEPDSPYGATKLCEEKLCLAYAKLYEIEAVALRYFNVYGPRQRFDAYGNVIPIFVFKMLRGEPLTVFGDGEQTRDFVNVHDVVQANILAARSTGTSGAFNIASGTSITVNALLKSLEVASGIRPTVDYAAPRPGDVRHSLADISAASRVLGYRPRVEIGAGISEYMDWARREVSGS